MSTPKFYIEKVNEGLWLVVDSHNHVVEQFKSFEEAREYFLFINRKGLHA